MRTGTVLAILPALLLVACHKNDRPSPAIVKEVTEQYFDVEVRDPYRYMENMDDTLFLNWLKEYSSYSRKVLDGIPGRAALIKTMEEFDSRRSQRIYMLSCLRMMCIEG